MQVAFKVLKTMLEESYDLGRTSNHEMRDQIVEEVIVRNKVAKPQELTIYTVEELRQFPVGSKFCHSLLGRGEVVTKKGVRNAFMKFDSGVTHAFTADMFPWDMPMIYLG